VEAEYQKYKIQARHSPNCYFLGNLWIYLYSAILILAFKPEIDYLYGIICSQLYGFSAWGVDPG